MVSAINQPRNDDSPPIKPNQPTKTISYQPNKQTLDSGASYSTPTKNGSQTTNSYTQAKTQTQKNLGGGNSGGQPSQASISAATTPKITTPTPSTIPKPTPTKTNIIQGKPATRTINNEYQTERQYIDSEGANYNQPNQKNNSSRNPERIQVNNFGLTSPIAQGYNPIASSNDGTILLQKDKERKLDKTKYEAPNLEFPQTLQQANKLTQEQRNYLFDRDSPKNSITGEQLINAAILPTRTISDLLGIKTKPIEIQDATILRNAQANVYVRDTAIIKQASNHYKNPALKGIVEIGGETFTDIAQAVTNPLATINRRPIDTVLYFAIPKALEGAASQITKLSPTITNKIINFGSAAAVPITLTYTAALSGELGDTAQYYSAGIPAGLAVFAATYQGIGRTANALPFKLEKGTLGIELGNTAIPLAGKTKINLLDQDLKAGIVQESKLQTAVFKKSLPDIASQKEVNRFDLYQKSQAPIEKQQSKFIKKYFSSKTETLSPKGTKTVLNFLKEQNNLKGIGVKSQVFGSYAAETQMPNARTPADIDIYFNTGRENTRKLAEKLTQKLLGAGEKVRLGKTGSLIEAKVNGNYRHAIDIKSNQPDLADLQNPALAKNQIYGFKLNQGSIKIDDLNAMKLSEQGVRKAGSTMIFREITPEYKTRAPKALTKSLEGKYAFAPEAHRAKDIKDTFAISETLYASKTIKDTKGQKALSEFKKLYDQKLFSKNDKAYFDSSAILGKSQSKTSLSSFDTSALNYNTSKQSTSNSKNTSPTISLYSTSNSKNTSPYKNTYAKSPNIYNSPSPNSPSNIYNSPSPNSPSNIYNSPSPNSPSNIYNSPSPNNYNNLNKILQAPTFTGGDIFQQTGNSKPTRKIKRKGRYEPDLNSIIYGIKSKSKAPKILSGLETRPLRRK